MPVTRLGGILGVALLLTACSASTDSTQELATPSEEETPLSTEEFLDETLRVSSPVFTFCITLQNEINNRKDIPEMLDCKLDVSEDRGLKAVIVDLADQTEFLLDGDDAGDFEIDEDSVLSLVAAPLEGMATAYQKTGGDDLAEADLFLIFFKDLCQNIWEIQPSTLARLGAGDITTEEALNQVNITELRGCTPPPLSPP